MASIRKMNKELGGKLDMKDWLVMIGASIGYALVSMLHIGSSSVWFDESFGAYLIRFDFIKIWEYTAADVHPPLYYWTLKLWSGLFGNSDVALRTMSVVFGVVALIFIYKLARRVFGRKAGVFAVLFAMLSPILVRYGMEMRMYTMMLAIAIAATYYVVRAKRDGKRKYWVVYGVLVSLGMWTHYFMALVWLAHFAWLVWTTMERKQRIATWAKKFFTKNLLIGYAVALGLFLPWLVAFIKQVLIVQTAGFWIPPVNLTTIAGYLSNSVFYEDASAIPPFLTLFFMILMVLGITIMVRAYRGMDRDKKRDYMLILMTTFLPIIILIALSMPPLQSSFVSRYLVTSSVMLMVLVGVSLATFDHTKTRHWLLVLVFVAAPIIGIANVYHYGNFNKETGNMSGAKQLVARVYEESTDNESIVSASPWLFYDTVFYETDRHQVYYVDELVDYVFGSLTPLANENVDRVESMREFARQRIVFWWIDDFDGKADVLGMVGEGWEKSREVVVNDPYHGKPTYRASLYTRTDGVFNTSKNAEY